MSLESIHRKATERIAQVQQAIREGAHSLDEIADKVNILPVSLRQFARQHDLPIPGVRIIARITDDEKARRIRKHLKSVQSLEELCTKTKVAIGVILKVSKDYEIELPEALRVYKTSPEMDLLIDEGRSLREIAHHPAVNLTIQRVSQYIQNSGQHNRWKQKRKEIKLKQEMKVQENISARRQFLSVLEARIAKNLPAERAWAYQKACEYNAALRVRSSRNYSFERLTALFERYHQALEQGKRLSLEELGEGLDIYSTDVGRIFRKIGLIPMYGNRLRPTREYYAEKKKALHRAFSVKMSQIDIAYFLNTSNLFVRQKLFKKRKQRRSGIPNGIKRFGHHGKNGVLTYRLASQIYEARNAAFTLEETVQLLDTTKPVVEYALAHKREIAPVIIDALQRLYPHEKIRTPYKLRH